MQRRENQMKTTWNGKRKRDEQHEARARERSKPMSRQSYRNDRSIEASSRGAGDGDSGGEKEVESGAEEDQWGRSPDLHFDKKSREKFSPISVVPYLILYRSLVSEG